MKSVIYTLLFFTVFVSFTRAGTTMNSTSNNNEFAVSGVNDYSFKFDDGETGSVIIFSSKELTQCRLSLTAGKFVDGYKDISSQLGEKNLDLTCLSATDHYALSPNNETSIALSVLINNDSAHIKLNFKLFGVKSKQYLERSNIELSLTKQQVKSIKSGHP
ncbi:hypothetical protein [Agaribacterium sp. ZY112]|uniref:hypothetical protein n=1 Tax=Agaribacterium sp. ZY112 TaxID=3233574 RepID=UPI0035267DD5